MRVRQLFIFACAISVGLMSCRKSERDNNTSTKASSDHAMHERLVNDIIAFVDEAARTTQGIKALNCATVTVDTIAAPKLMTIDFNAFPGCTGSDGFKRSGVVTATFTSKYSVVGSVITISSNNYRTENLKMSFSLTMTYMGLDTNSNPYFEVSTTAMEVEPLTEAWVSTWAMDYTRTMSAGALTPSDASDDSYILTGSGTGTSRSGNTYEVEILTPLTVSNTCEYPNSGIVQVRPANLTPRTLDYGSGCDATASIAIVDTDYEIEIE